MKTSRAALHLLLVVACLIVSACGNLLGVTGPPDELEGDWRLTSGTTPDGEVPLVDGHPVTLSIDGSDWGGTAACNSYGATVELADDQLEIRELMWTEMACLDDGVMASEAAYLDAFLQVERFQVTDEGLVLQDTPGDVRLTYTRVPAEDDAALAGTTWRVVSLIEGDGPDGAASSAQPGATVVLHPDGRVDVDSTCTPQSGDYEMAGDDLIVTNLAGDGPGCDGLVGDQHDHLLRVFSTAVSFEVEGSSLWLMNRDGAGLDLRADG